MQPGSIPWQWREEPGEPGGEVTLAAGVETLYALLRGADGTVAGIVRTDAGQQTWSTAIPAPLAGKATLLAGGGRLYAALYSGSATGCEVIALDAASGSLLWRTSLRGLGPLHHSKYRNRVQLYFNEGWPVVFGDEAAGRYVEALEPKDGRTIYNQRVYP